MQLLTTTFVFTIIHESSFSIISLTECQEALSEGNLENKRVIFYMELTFADEVLVLIPTRIGDFTDFLRDISLDN